MKVLLTCFLFFLTIGISTPSKNKRLTEDEFEEKFHLPKVTDPVEKARREKALAEAQEKIEQVNEDFRKGKKTWSEKLYEFSNLPKDEFVRQKTGDLGPDFGFGDFNPIGSEEDHEESDFSKSDRTKRETLPASYDSVKLGLVTPVRNQYYCGACAAFAALGAIETCFKRVTGAFSDFSEQQLLDCGKGMYGRGCGGGTAYSYFDMLKRENMDLLAEATYPYKNNDTMNCPTGLLSYNRGAKVTNYWGTSNGNEKSLMELVAKHGAVAASLDGVQLRSYEKGVYEGCNANFEINHAVAVVGYGTDDEGVDYWLIKNSWGDHWGDNGYIRLQRGVGMCGIGRTYAFVECEAVSGPTSPTLTTEDPCHDQYKSCKKDAEKWCFRDKTQKRCPRSCGLCEGMTPVPSNTCYDEYTNCPDLAKKWCFRYTSKCKKSCGLCAGMTPVPSNTCYDEYTSCPELAKTSCYRLSSKCMKSCGLCAGMTPVSSNQCYDTNSTPFCLQNIADCTRNKDWAKKYCNKSCGLC